MTPKLELATEYPPADEQRHIDSLIRNLRGKMERDYAGRPTLRDAHPKMHGCVRGEFSIAPGLPPELSIGLFRESRAFPVWIRFSNQSGTVFPDSKADIRGVAIKLMGVPGEKLLQNAPTDTTHDFILISDSRFVTKDVAEFDGLVGAIMGGTLQKIWYFLTHLRVVRNFLSSLRRFSSPLSIRYFSVVPHLLGNKAVKYSLTPHNPGEAKAPSNASDNYLRKAMVAQLGSAGAVFDFAVQFQTDPYKMPIEDPGVTWDETLSPFRKVATLTIPGQIFDTPKRDEFGDNLSFNPWRCLPEHRPLSGISRARRQVYEALSKFRHERNEAPRIEPTVNDGEWVANNPEAP